jgi:hypothetical protein
LEGNTTLLYYKLLLQIVDYNLESTTIEDCSFVRQQFVTRQRHGLSVTNRPGAMSTIGHAQLVRVSSLIFKEDYTSTMKLEVQPCLGIYRDTKIVDLETKL